MSIAKLRTIRTSTITPREAALSSVGVTTMVRTTITAIRSVRHGRMLVAEAMLSDLIDRLLRQAATHDEALKRIHQLTPRERAVLALLSQGQGNVAVAERLFIGPHTARTHIQNVIAKLGMHSRLEAATFVAQTGIMDELAASTV